MERVAFLVERTGERIGCLLNPETLTVQRRAGLVRRDISGMPVHAAGLADEPLIYTGGGSTTFLFDLLFDTTLASGSSRVVEDVRQLTRPLWDLAENHTDDTAGAPPTVLFVWGRAWNVAGVITAVAERLESFTDGGVPRRSWLRMRFQRVLADATLPHQAPLGSADLEALRPALDVGQRPAVREPLLAPPAIGPTVAVTGGDAAVADQRAVSPTRLDELADRHLGDARLWRLIAWRNGVADPLRIAAGQLLTLPSRRAAGSRP